jgi:gliding motility-associated-like protein
MTKKLLTLYALLLACSVGFAQTEVPAMYSFFHGDTLDGFDLKTCYNEMGKYHAQVHLSQLEKEKYMYIREKAYVQKKYNPSSPALPANYLLSPGATAEKRKMVNGKLYKVRQISMDGSTQAPLVKAKTAVHPNQTLAGSCSDLDFESGVPGMGVWTGSMGYTTPASFLYYGLAPISGPSINGQGVYYGGLNAPIHSCTGVSLVGAGSGNDPFCPATPMVCPGGSFSLRLGDDKCNVGNVYGPCGWGDSSPPNESAGEIVELSIPITAANCLLTYRYQVVLADGGHGAGDQPFFEAAVTDHLGAQMNCSVYYQECTNGVPPTGYSTSPLKDPIDAAASVFYSGWQSNTFDLSSQIGFTVLIDFFVAGCVPGGHFGYAYVDGSCGPLALAVSSPAVCLGSTETVTAPPTPPGTSYVWSGPGIVSGQGTSVITVNAAGTYQVSATLPAPNNSCPIVVSTVVNFLPNPTITPTSASPSCNAGSNGTATATAGGAGAFTWNWTGGTYGGGGQGTQTATALAAGTYTCTLTQTNGCTATHVYTITAPAVVAGTATPTSATCNGGSTGSILANPTGGSGTYSTYSWNSTPSQNTQTATGLPAGTYICTVTDNKGCIGTVTGTIGQPSAVTATNTEVDATCNGGANGHATANPSGGTGAYTYNWSPAPGGGQGTITATGLSAQTYICTVTDNKGCTTTTTAVINQPAAITITPTSQTNSACTSSTGTASVSVGGGTPAFTYTWSPAITGGQGQGTPNATGLSAQPYTVTVHDSKGCPQSAVITIGTAGGPTSSIASSTNLTCNAACIGAINVTASGGTGAISYAWSPVITAGQGAGTANASALCAGTYVCTMTDVNGCTTSQSHTITQPSAITATSSSVNAACGLSNGTASVTPSGGTPGPGYTYNWSPAPGAGQGTASVSGLAAATYNCIITDASTCTYTATIAVNNSGGPTATSVTTNPLCNAACTGVAKVTAVGGTGTITYNWSPAPPVGQGTNTASSLCAGVYICTITDANNCITSQTDSVKQPVALVIAPSSTNVLCNAACNGTATATPSGGTGAYAYNWGGGLTTQTINGLCPNVYSCTVTDANNCPATQTYTITQPNVLAPVPSQTNVTCNGNGNGTASVNAIGGSPLYTYLWSPGSPTGQGTSSITSLTPGVYSCLTTDANGCTNTQTFTIVEPGVLAVTPIQTNPSCGGNTNGSATVSVSGGTASYTYAWSPGSPTGQGTATITGLGSGTVNCLVTDSNNCTISQAFTIVQPAPLNVAPSQTNETCNGNNDATATATPSGGTGMVYTYAWNTTPVQTSAVATALPIGPVICTVTDSMGCSTTTTITITQPGVLSVAPSQVDVTCNGLNNGTATASTTGGTVAYTYAWNSTPTQSTQTATGLPPGPVSVTVTDANGCSTIQNYTIVQPLPLSATTIDSTTHCNLANGAATATAGGGTGPYTYNWNTAPAQTTQTASSLASGNYICTIKDAHGCTSTASVSVPASVNNVTAHFTPSVVTGASPLPVTYMDSSTINPTAWSWTFGDGGTSTAQNPTHTFAAPGVYTVTEVVTDANGCHNTFTLTIEVHELPSFLDIPNVFTPNGDGNNDNWQVHYQGISSYDVRIYDRWGVMMTELFAPAQGWDGRTSGGLVAVSGTYYYILKAEGDDGKKYDATGFLMLIRN